MGTTNDHVVITTKIDKQVFEDLFITAFEGGSSYWAEVKERTPDSEGESSSERWFNHIWNGGWMAVYDAEDEETCWDMNKQSMIYGLQMMADNHTEVFSRMVDGDYDAGDADMWFQYSVIGEIMFG